MACLIPLMTEAADQHFETLRVGDEVFRDVTVIQVTATDVYFTHSGGMGNAKLSRVNEDLQQQFGYDPKQAAAVEQSQREGANRFAARMQQERVRDRERASAARRRADAEALAAEQRLQQMAAALQKSACGPCRALPHTVRGRLVFAKRYALPTSVGYSSDRRGHV